MEWWWLEFQHNNPDRTVSGYDIYPVRLGMFSWHFLVLDYKRSLPSTTTMYHALFIFDRFVTHTTK